MPNYFGSNDDELNINIAFAITPSTILSWELSNIYMPTIAGVMGNAKIKNKSYTLKNDLLMRSINGNYMDVHRISPNKQRISYTLTKLDGASVNSIGISIL